MKHLGVLLLAVAVLVAGCGSDPATSGETGPSSVAPIPTTVTVGPDTTIAATVHPTTTTSAPPVTTERFDVQFVRNLTWTTPNMEPPLAGVEVQRTVGEEWALEVGHPVETPPDGWPVVVVFHGTTTFSALSSGMTELARRGAVVVAPRWAPPAWSIANLYALSAEEYSDGYWFDVGACALSAAQQVASEYGGDPTRTTVVGFSAGVHPAAWTGLGVVRNNLCPDRERFTPPIGMVLGDAQWLFQAEPWDETFLDPNSLAKDTVDRFVNPQRWVGVPDDFYAYLWNSESRAWARGVENPPSPDSWLSTRHDDMSTLLADLESIGAFDDGVILFPDNGLLLAKRLGEAGITVMQDSVATDHNYTRAILDRIEQIVVG